MTQIDPRLSQPHSLPCGNGEIAIPGPAGELEALVSCPEQESGPVAAVCHPHPLYGGTMHNKVVHFMTKSLADVGVPAVRFNFRGVGRSGGEYTAGPGEAEDLRAVIRWLRQHAPGRPLWLAGFSFGAYIAYREASANDVQLLITVAPPVERFDFASAPEPGGRWLLIQGEADEVVSAQAVREWAGSLSHIPEVVFLEGVGHFFHGRLVELRQILRERLRRCVPSE